MTNPKEKVRRCVYCDSQKPYHNNDCPKHQDNPAKKIYTKQEVDELLSTLTQKHQEEMERVTKEAQAEEYSWLLKSMNELNKDAVTKAFIEARLKALSHSTKEDK